jgi:hypothetical protein
MSQNNIIYQIHRSTPLFIQLVVVLFPIISSNVGALEHGYKHLVLLSPPACLDA